MILNNWTAAKVKSLLNIPINTVEYNGSYGDTVDFLVGMKNETKDWISGVCLSVTENFEIKKVQRITLIQGRFTNNYPVRRITIPIYSPITKAKGQ